MDLIVKLLGILSAEFKTAVIAAMPIIELRGAIPFGISYGLSPVHAFVVSFLGSMLPVPILLLGIRPVFKILSQTPLLKKWVDHLSVRSIRKSKNIKKYGFLGLLIFVAIPLPGTGVWSGTLAAALLDIRFKTAFPAILIGNFIAGMVIMAISYGIINVII
ncbi:MAG: ligand-binding protein SH3 [Clostridiales bacterium 38-18]|nr:MAG: ligand-binding protein SH3 [Clostridiales bacterium 38-18]